MKQKSKSNFTLDNLIKGYVQDFYLYASHQFDFLRQIDDYVKAHPGHPIMHVQYEDLKKDSVSVIKELAKFLELDVSEEFCKEVSAAVSFDAMKKIDHERDPPQDVLEALKGKLKIYRKGEVGDWKNHLTVAQNETIDAFISAQEKKGISHTFQFE
ncbi:sulfotransferase [Elysia marginata]|uniref:Sulfotransferase n=1 Tax=Elysia marginata TaxID=1093978 RepID=A0AAV4ESK8_9GAST|nr:sulfotransferase [Elysia marginata]